MFYLHLLNYITNMNNIIYVEFSLKFLFFAYVLILLFFFIILNAPASVISFLPSAAPHEHRWSTLWAIQTPPERVFYCRRTTQQTRVHHNFPQEWIEKDRERGKKKRDAVCTRSLCWGLECKYDKVRGAQRQLCGKLIEFPTSLLMWDMERKFQTYEDK